MPLYEYECERCGARFEIIQRFSDPAVEACRTCGGPVHKLISAPAIQFKGTGWYITDYAKKSGNGGSASSSSPSSSASSTSSSSDSKSETKSDAKSDSSSSSSAASSPANGGKKDGDKRESGKRE